MRNAPRNLTQYKKELILAKQQNIDETKVMKNSLEEFLTNLCAFESVILSKKFSTAIEQIDKSINNLQKQKDALLSADNNYRIAFNNKAQEVTIKKLTKNNPTMQKILIKY